MTGYETGARVEWFDLAGQNLDPKIFWLLILVIVAALFLVPLWTIWRRQRDEENKILDRLARLLAAARHGRNWSGVYECYASHKGIPYVFRFDSQDSFSFDPAYFSVTISHGSGASFRIVKGDGGGLSETSGLSHAIHTGDAGFDRDYLVSTDRRDFTAGLLKDPAVRAAVRRCFELGYTALIHRKATLEAEWRPFRIGEDIERDHITQTVSLLRGIADKMPVLPRYRTLRPEPRLDRDVVAVSVLPAIPVALLFAGMVLCAVGALQYAPLDGGDMALYSLLVSVPAALAFVVSCFYFYGDHHLRHRKMLLIMMVSLLAFPLFGAGLFITLNGALDTGRPAAHVVKVVREEAGAIGMAARYRVFVESWRREGGEELLRVPARYYKEVLLNRTRLTVVTCPGRFGFEWIKSVRLEKTVEPAS